MRDVLRRLFTADWFDERTAYADSPVGRLSGGEQQRLRVAQALVGGPDVLLCDEPLLSLDLAHQRTVTDLIDARRHAANTAVLFVTHEINPVLPLVDLVLYVINGRFRLGTPDEVMTTDVAKATAFYTDVLGVSWEQMQMEGGPAYTCLVVDGRQVGGAMTLPDDSMSPHWNVYFNVTSTDETVARATELGASVVAPAFDVPTVGRMAILADPQGGMFCLLQNPQS